MVAEGMEEGAEASCIPGAELPGFTHRQTGDPSPTESARLLPPLLHPPLLGFRDLHLVRCPAARPCLRRMPSRGGARSRRADWRNRVTTFIYPKSNVGVKSDTFRPHSWHVQHPSRFPSVDECADGRCPTRLSTSPRVSEEPQRINSSAPGSNVQSHGHTAPSA